MPIDEATIDQLSRLNCSATMRDFHNFFLLFTDFFGGFDAWSNFNARFNGRQPENLLLKAARTRS